MANTAAEQAAAQTAHLASVRSLDAAAAPSSDQLHAGAAVGGSHGGEVGAFGTLGGSIGAPTDSQGLPFAGASPGFDGFLAPMNSNPALGDVMHLLEEVASHQAGGKFQIADHPQTGQGLSAAAPAAPNVVKPINLSGRGVQGE
jgi:hypothetical protein